MLNRTFFCSFVLISSGDLSMPINYANTKHVGKGVEEKRKDKRQRTLI